MNSFAAQYFDFVRSVTSESRLRMAPTPSGFLHIGNALNFSLQWLAAKYCGGSVANGSPATLFLRIDDLDNDRKRPEFLDDIFETLEWLKLDWNGEPIVQSRRTASYFKVLDQLKDRNLIFACRKSRREIELFNHRYSGEFREQNLDLNSPDVAWRIKTPADFPLPDFVVRRRDGIPAYQVASFADELGFGITHVLRGADLEDSTLAQQFIAQSLDEAKFLKIRFLHHPLLLDQSGEKLSKSAGSTALISMRRAGMGPEMIFQTVGQYLGLEGDSAVSLLESLRSSLA